ncbi:MAG: hypothetical protein ACOYU7_06185 [Bacillota bacterium]|uniref:Uncharacterized protein n=1 Tax=Thermoanaerobaculum aquaticum TaxID=1312852 RepID=A0A062XQZ9_9BACT|nr:hypothetical protein [Thermoanaerobaculum aquaticum]KDA53243.1 hypothetical protein EG19_06575 [Thermoanaerobaculum aquaticum]BCW92246.1 MAG: hypothetical protein KatS3mg007_0140 [Thermoanaerobaculum sp.]
MSEIPNPFYLASKESYALSQPRRCFPIRRVATDKRSDLLLVRIDPPLIGQAFGLGAKDIEYLVLAPRHESVSLFPVSEWPAHVHVARILRDAPETRGYLEPSELEEIGWGEIYPDQASALVDNSDVKTL